MREPNKEHIRLLVEALRSQRFVQGKSTLCTQVITDDGVSFTHCVLGVACEVARENGLEVTKMLVTRSLTDSSSTKSVNPVLFDEHGGTLPDSVRNWYGFASNEPRVLLPEEGSDGLINLNDEHGWSFERLADAIEHTFL